MNNEYIFPYWDDIKPVKNEKSENHTSRKKDPSKEKRSGKVLSRNINPDARRDGEERV